VPLVLWIVAGASAETSLAPAAIRLAILVVLPTIAGYLIACRASLVRRVASRCRAVVASIALLWIIASVVAANREQLWHLGPPLVAALAAINLVGYAAGYAVGRWSGLPENYGRALTLEVGMQNAGLGTALAVSLYGIDTIATIPTAGYTFGCMLTGTVLAVWWSSVE